MNNKSILQTKTDQHKEANGNFSKELKKRKDCRERSVTEKPHVRQSNPETYEVMLAYQKS